MVVDYMILFKYDFKHLNAENNFSNKLFQFKIVSDKAVFVGGRNFHPDLTFACGQSWSKRGQ